MGLNNWRPPVRSPDTIDAIQGPWSAGAETDRIGHARQLIGRLAVGDPLGPGVQHLRGLYGPAGGITGHPRRLRRCYVLGSLVLAVALEKR